MTHPLTNDDLAKVKFVDDGTNWQTPVEPELLRRLEMVQADRRLCAPNPSVLQALSSQSVALFDLGVRSGITWGHDYLKSPESLRHKSIAYDQFNRMRPLVDRKRPHLYRSYAEGWLHGWASAMNLEV